MALTEDGINLPQDSGKRRFSAGYSSAGGLRAPRLSDTEYHTIIQDEKGVPTCTQLTATTSPQLLLAANPLRKSAEIYNNSTLVTIYIDRSTTPSSATSKPVKVGLEYLDKGGQSAWYVVAESGTADVRVTEFT